MNTTHSQVKSAFTRAFAEMQKQGIKMKSLDWFLPESKKSVRRNSKTRKAA